MLYYCSMWRDLINLGGVRITWMAVALVVGFGVACFKVWREMRSDYEEDKVLGAMLGLTLASWVGARVSWWKPAANMGMIGAVVAGGLFLAWWCKRQKWNFWQWLDQVGEVSLAVGFVAAFAYGRDMVGVGLVLVLGWLTSGFVRRYYRKWTWYESGKPGLTGLVTVWWWVVAELVVAKDWGVWVYFAAWLTVGAVVIVYLRSGRKVSQDLKRIWPKRK